MELKRSTDAGGSFSAPLPLLDDCASVGSGSSCPDSTAFNGGTLVYCNATGAFHLLFSIGNPSGNLSIKSSLDGGVSWTAPRPVTNSKNERFVTSGQVNRGLELQHGPHAGRLVVPREVFLGPSSPANPDTPGGFENKAGVVYSDTHGESECLAAIAIAALE